MKNLSALSSLAVLLFAFNARAQSLQETVKKIKSLHTVSFTELVKFKLSFQDDFSIDTLKSQTVLVPQEPQIGGYYQIKAKKDTYIFNGNKSIHLDSRDSTFYLATESEKNQFTRSLLYWNKKIETYLKSPSKIKQLKDTVIDNTAYYHFLITLADSIKNNERVHDFVVIVTDKKTQLPFIINYDFKGIANDGAKIGVIEQHLFRDYKINEKNFPKLSDAKVPENYKMPPPKVTLPPMPTGTKAPHLNLQNLTGKAFDIDQLKGKVVLLNFSLLDCPHCINSEQMLTRLNEKYKDTDFQIISIYQKRLDKQDAISKFDAKFNVKYPSYITEDPAKELYNLNGYPCFFLLDKSGYITQVSEGFYAGLEKELTDKINSIK